MSIYIDKSDRYIIICTNYGDACMDTLIEDGSIEYNNIYEMKWIEKKVVIKRFKDIYIWE